MAHSSSSAQKRLIGEQVIWLLLKWKPPPPSSVCTWVFTLGFLSPFVSEGHFWGRVILVFYGLLALSVSSPTVLKH